MAKAGRVLSALLKSGWAEVARKGSHHKLRKGDQTRIFSYHDKYELGKTQLAIVAKDYGLTVEELKKLL